MSSPFEADPEDRKIIDDAMARLGEHFDSVQVFASRLLPNGETESFHRGQGNWNTRWGHVERWVRMIKNSDNREDRKDDEADSD